jgi:hypothetical protein
MSNIALTIQGTLMGEDGETLSVQGTVSEPTQGDNTGDWLSTVSCPGLFPDETIKGASAGQALHLGRLFLLDALETNGVAVAEGSRNGH